MATKLDLFAISTSDYLSDAVVCHHFHCFWVNCPEWVMAWFTCSATDFICGCWALFELIHIMQSISRIKKSSLHNLFVRNHSKLGATASIKDEPTPDIYGNLNQSFGYNQQQNTPAMYSNVKPLYPSPSSMKTKTKSMYSSPSVSRSQGQGAKVQMFETRFSQKLFLIFIFISMWSRSFCWAWSPFTLTQCSMTKIDTPTLFYAVLRLKISQSLLACSWDAMNPDFKA